MARMRILAICVLALMLAPAAAQRSVRLDSAGVRWQPVEIPGVPKGMLQRLLHENKQKQTMTAIFRFPKGFRDPKHYHTTCGHSLYILKGKLETPGGALTTGMFLYSAPNERHGPLVAVEETDMLLFTDGPLDYHLAE
jgi:quercetin dioxygenase-like cupin family protein